MSTAVANPEVTQRITLELCQCGSDPLWFFDLNLNGRRISHERIERSYGSPRDCLTSAGHLCQELQKKGEL
jgi:hypothetical protein